MKISFFLLLIIAWSSADSFAGGSTGGGFPSVQLESIALSETPIEVGDAGVLISVSSADFEEVAANVSENSGITYHDAEAKAVSVDQENKAITLRLTESPAIVLVVKEDSRL